MLLLVVFGLSEWRLILNPFLTPLPKYVDIEHLFYRWGFSQYGPNRRELFIQTLNSCISNDGLITRLNILEEVYLPDEKQSYFMTVAFPNNAASTELKDSWPSTDYLLRGAKTKPPYDIPEHRRFLWFDGDDKPDLNFHGLDYAYFLDDETVFFNEAPVMNCVISSDGCSVFSVVLDNKIDKYLGRLCVVSEYDAEVASVSPLKKMPNKIVRFERDNLKAVEQRAGFIKHGLSDEQLKEYAPEISEYEKRVRKKNAYNEKIKLKENDIKPTLDACRVLRDKNRYLYPSNIQEAVGDEIGASRTTVIKHLKIADKLGLLTVEEKKFYFPKKYVTPV